MRTYIAILSPPLWPVNHVALLFTCLWSALFSQVSGMSMLCVCVLCVWHVYVVCGRSSSFVHRTNAATWRASPFLISWWRLRVSHVLLVIACYQYTIYYSMFCGFFSNASSLRNVRAPYEGTQRRPTARRAGELAIANELALSA